MAQGLLAFCLPAGFDVHRNLLKNQTFTSPEAAEDNAAALQMRCWF
jgi:hypothetical protein